MWATREHDDGKTGSYVQVYAQHNTSTWDKTWLHPQAACRGFPTAALGMQDEVLKFRSNPDSTPCFATSLVFNTYLPHPL